MHLRHFPSAPGDTPTLNGTLQMLYRKAQDYHPYNLAAS